jgi:hypothetical protein
VEIKNRQFRDKHQRKPKWKSRIDNSEKHATLGTRHRTKTIKKINTKEMRNTKPIKNLG